MDLKQTGDNIGGCFLESVSLNHVLPRVLRSPDWRMILSQPKPFLKKTMHSVHGLQNFFSMPFKRKFHVIISTMYFSNKNYGFNISIKNKIKNGPIYTLTDILFSIGMKKLIN